jgi:hypothetical protein
MPGQKPKVPAVEPGWRNADTRDPDRHNPSPRLLRDNLEVARLTMPYMHTKGYQVSNGLRTDSIWLLLIGP